MAERRRYTKRTKVMAVLAAAGSSVAAAAQAQGIPERTVGYWFDSPEFADLRAKTQEDRAAEAKAMAHVVLGEIRRRLPEFEPKDLSVLYGILTDKGQLLAGAATSRTETKTFTDGMDDHERQQLRAVLEGVLAGVPDAVAD